MPEVNGSYTNPTAIANGADDDNMEMAFFSNRGCCFWLPCLNANRPSSSNVGPSWWQPINTADSPTTATTSTKSVDVDHWWTRGWKKLRELSEIIAGPKWKTFIRRFNTKNRSGNVGGRGARKFQYDELSYSLNFDEGPGHCGHFYDDEDALNRAFSTRYASLPASAKCSMDLGKDNAPLFT